MAGPNMSIPAGGLCDQALVRRVRSGDQCAFTEIVRSYEPRLTRFALRLMSNPSDAEDAVQEAFLRAFVALRRDGRPINLAPWLHTILRNCAIDLLRRPAHQALPFEPASDVTTPDHVAGRERMRNVVSAVAGLPARQRDPLVLHVLGDQPYAQIAQDQDLSVAAVKALISRARSQLRAMDLGQAA